MSKTQVDRLGDALRARSPTEDELRQLEAYKQSFGTAYNLVVETLQRHSLSVKGRPEKSTLSIAAKLRREKMRLSRMQDIAGCRIVVPNIAAQNHLTVILCNDFPSATVKDRRKAPRHGYRAVHLIVPAHSKLVEVQIRTLLQQLWGELSEKISDVFGLEIKYGGGPSEWRNILIAMSQIIERYESEESGVNSLGAEKSRAESELQSIHDSVWEWLTGKNPQVEPPHTLDEFTQRLREVEAFELEIPKRQSDLTADRRIIIEAIRAVMVSLDRRTEGEP